MKNLLPILAIVAILAFSSNLHAQDSKFGLRMGLNFSSIAGDDAPDELDGKTGLYAGFYYDYAYSDLFGTEAGLFYSEVGASSSNDTTALNLSYIEIPFVFKYYVIREVSLELGAQYAFLASATDGLDEDVSGFFDTDDISLLFGSAYKFDFGLVVGLRYRMGLDSFANGDDISFSTGLSEQDLKNNATQISVGFLF